jgi:hypothetical protein
MLRTLILALLLIGLSTALIGCATNAGSPVTSPVASPITTPATSTSGTKVTPQTPAVGQQLIVDEILASLKQRGVPVLSARFTDFALADPPIMLEFTLQSAGVDGQAASEDPINISLIERAANLAQRHGLRLGAVGIVFVDSLGQEISSLGTRAAKIGDLPSIFDPPFSLDDEAVTALLRQEIQLTGPATLNIRVYPGIGDLREAVFNLGVTDIQAANAVLGIVGNAMNIIQKLNLDKDTQISAYRINIVDAGGNPLLTYMNDLTQGGGHQTAWEANGLANWGYPGPPPAPPATLQMPR